MLSICLKIQGKNTISNKENDDSFLNRWNIEITSIPLDGSQKWKKKIITCSGKKKTSNSEFETDLKQN